MKLWRNLLSAMTAAALCIPCSLPAAALEEPLDYLVGDGNADGTVDVLDVVLLQKHLLAVPIDQYYILDRFDLDHNDEVDIYDLARLKRVAIGMDEPEVVHVPEPFTEPHYIEPTVTKFGDGMPNMGESRLLSVFVEFADRKFRDEALSAEAINSRLYGSASSTLPYDSITGWYERASYGTLHVSGDAVYYTCSGNMSDYMFTNDSGTPLYETMAMEVLRGLDDQINYADFDADNDGCIDCVSFCVPLENPTPEEDEFWWSSMTDWYYNPYFSVDGKRVARFVITDHPPYEDKMNQYISTMVHEMGHCIGLPDYYIYGDGSHWNSQEGFLSDAGMERMDDSVGDFSSFSKIMIGWMDQNYVYWYQGENGTGKGTEQFTLEDLSVAGNCVILPINAEYGDYTSEYFIVEYVTPISNNTDVPRYCWHQNSGVRIFHVDAELFTDQWNRTLFRYENFSPFFDANKRRVIRLVNDGNPIGNPNYTFYQTGDVCTFGTSNFAGYDANGDQTIDTGYTVTVNSFSDGRCTLTVTRE